MRKRLFKKLTSGTYGMTPKMYKWFVQNNSIALAKWYGDEIKRQINFSLDEQIKFIKKDAKRKVKQIKFLIKYFPHYCDEKSIYICTERNCKMQFDKSIIEAVETNNYMPVLIDFMVCSEGLYKEYYQNVVLPSHVIYNCVDV